MSEFCDYCDGYGYVDNDDGEEVSCPACSIYKGVTEKPREGEFNPLESNKAMLALMQNKKK